MKGLQSLYFIWEAFGTLLRALSLSGRWGNVLSWCLYILISLFPILVPGLWMQKRKHRACGRDLLLVLLSAYTFYLIYAFINPGIMSRRMPSGIGTEGALPYLKAVYGGLWLSIFVSWLLLTWIGTLNHKEISDRKEFLYQGMGLLLTAAMVILGVSFLYSEGMDLYGRILGIRANTAGSEWLSEVPGSRNGVGWETVFVFLRAVVRLLPVCFLLGIFYRIKNLLKAMEREPFGEGEVLAAKKLARVSQRAVRTSVFCDLLWNGALFLCMEKLSNVDYQWELSLFPLLTAFGALILARYLKEAGELRRDNEMII